MPPDAVGRARRIARAVRHGPDRLLHPARRRAARRRVAGLRPKRILVLCHGNICRSPFAEAALRSRLEPAVVDVSSAGFILPGRPAPPLALEVASERGYDLSEHRSRVVTHADVAAADLVLVMTPEQRHDVRSRFGAPIDAVLLLGDFDPGAIERRLIRDPIERPKSVFSDVFARIERCCASLSDTLIGQSGGGPGSRLAESRSPAPASQPASPER